MMVVMLILSIIMAAMAPVMTTRNKLDQSSPWVWAENGSDAYYGLGDAQVAMIGQQEAQDTDTNSRLVISTGLEKHHILFKTDNTVSGRLELSNHSVKLGEAANGAQAESANSVMIGNQALGYGEDSVAIGTASRANKYSTAVGDSSEASNSSTAYGYGTEATGTNSVSLGYQSEVSGANSIAVGFNNTVETQGAISIGSPSNAGANHAVALGMNSSATGVNSIAIGGGNESIDAARTNSSSSVAIGTGTTVSSNSSIGIGDTSNVGTNSANSIAIGSLSNATNTDTIAIGHSANATQSDAIAIGNSVTASGGSAIAIGSVETGHTTTASGTAAVAIGDGAYSTAYATIALGYSTEATTYGATALGADSIASGRSSIALGNNAIAKGENNIAIGTNACRYATGSNKVCIGANSGPSSSNFWATDSTERIFIGSKSAFNGADAVLEVHNNPNNTVYAHDGRVFHAKDSTVVINGNLIVKGTLTSWIVDRYGNYVTGFRTLERHKEGEENASLRYSAESGFGFDQYFRYGSGYTSSDRRLKYIGKESTSGLEKIKQLKVFNYTFKKDEKKTPHVGVIAQDLQKVFPDAVTKAKDGFLRIRFEDMFYAMINAIKELDSRITALEKENQELKEILKQVQNDNRKLQDDNKEFEARLKILETKIK